MLTTEVSYQLDSNPEQPLISKTQTKPKTKPLARANVELHSEFRIALPILRVAL